MNRVSKFYNEVFGEITFVTEVITGDLFLSKSDVFRILRINKKDLEKTEKELNLNLSISNEKEIDVSTEENNIYYKTMISERDVLKLITISPLKEAIQLEKWIFETVIPSIRKNDYFIDSNISKENLEILTKELDIRNTMLRNTFGTELKTVEQFVSEFNQITGEEYSLEQILKEFKRLRWVDKNFNITSTGYNRKIIDYKEKILISEYGRKLFVSNYDKRKREAQLDVSKSKEIDNSPF